MSPDGSVPADNPFARSPVWSLGHRNVQGLAWDAAGRLYAAEFGPDRDDDINLITPGGNYGWPYVTDDAKDRRFIDPIVLRQPAEASWSGLAIPNGSAVPAWDGSILAAALRGRRLWRFTLQDDTVTAAEELYTEQFGRLRTVVQAPDGSIWLLTSNRDGRGDPRPTTTGSSASRSRRESRLQDRRHATDTGVRAPRSSCTSRTSTLNGSGPSLTAFGSLLNNHAAPRPQMLPRESFRASFVCIRGEHGCAPPPPRWGILG